MANGPGTGGVTPRETGRGSEDHPSRDHLRKPSRSGTISPTFKSKGSNSATGSASGKTPPMIPIMSERQANVQEQSTGRRRPVQEMGADYNNDR